MMEGDNFIIKLTSRNKHELIKVKRESVSTYNHPETKNNTRRRRYEVFSCFKKNDIAMIFIISVDGNNEYRNPR